MRTVAQLCVAFLVSIITALIAGIAMTWVGSKPAVVLQAGGAAFVAIMLVGIGVIGLFNKSSSGDPDDGPPR